MNPNKYRPDIDGLRAIAVLSVFICHLNKSWLSGGFVGVDVFFVISGFLITSIIYNQGDNFSIKDFYARRIKRILPVFYFVCLITFLLSFYILLPENFIEAFKSLKTSTYFLQNIFFANNSGGYFDTDAYVKPFLHTWSLAVEEQFYLIFPILLIAFNKFNISNGKSLLILIVLAILSFGSSYLAIFDTEIARLNYYSLFTSRAGELLIGCIGAILFSNNKTLVTAENQQVATIIALIVLLVGFAFINDKSYYPSLISLMPTVSTLLIIYCGNQNLLVTKFLSNHVLVFIGKISYSLYLWHWPIIVLSKEYWLIEEFSVLQASLIFLTAFILSVFSYYLIEQPIRKKPYSFRKSFILFYVIPAGVIVSTYYGNKEFSFLDFGEKQQVLQYNLMIKMTDINDVNCNINNPCLLGNTNKKPKVLLVGDSHSQHISPFLNIAAKKYNISIEIISSFNCPLAAKYMRSNIYPNRVEACQKVIDQISNQKNIKDFDYILIGGRYVSYYSNEYLQELSELIQMFKKQGKTIVMFADIPYIHGGSLKKYKHQYIRKEKINRNDFLNANANSDVDKVNTNMQDFAKNNGVIFIDLFDPIIKSNKNNIKWPFKGDYILYFDTNHLNMMAPNLLKDEFLEQVEKSPLDAIFKQVRK